MTASRRIAAMAEKNVEGMQTDSANEDDDPLFVTKKRQRFRKQGAHQQPNQKPRKKSKPFVKIVTKKKKKSGRQERNLEDYDDSREVARDTDLEAKARIYQLEVFRESEKRNTIVYLETGCGKTLIAVLRLRSLAHRLRLPDQKRIAVFLVPTVNLVHQQSRVINCHMDLKLGAYVGNMKVDTWKPEKWVEEIALHEVLVMTPQILLDLLSHGILKLDIVEILILDECHHATKKHPYGKIMDRYRDTPLDRRPKVFGMTASPVIRRGVRSCADANTQLTALEQTLDAKVYAVKDRSELESFVPTPRTIGLYFDASTFPMENYKSKLEAIAGNVLLKHHQLGNAAAPFGRCCTVCSLEPCWHPHQYEANKGVGTPAGEQFKDFDEVGRKLHRAINKLYNALVYCIDNLGLWCAREAADVLLKERATEPSWEPNLNIVAVLKTVRDAFLRHFLDFLESAIPDSIPKDPNEDLSKQVTAGLLTPKVKLLVDVMMTYRDMADVKCIVFVDRVVTSRVLANLINQLKCLSYLRCGHLAGLNCSFESISHKLQQTTIENFLTGKINLVVATSVAEEGLDVQGCHSVIRFDPCKSVRSHIQSRGRARRPGSDYVVLMEEGNEREKQEFDDILQSEIKMSEKALDRLSELDTPIEPPAMTEVESFRVDSTGAIMTTDSTISFIYRFCSKLPGDRYYIPIPEFRETEGPYGMHVCILRLPPNSLIPELTGPARPTKLLAKQVVCLEACKVMHATGAITDNLLPVIDEERVNEVESMNLAKNGGKGTKKKKELHNMIIPSALKGYWGDAVNGASLHAYKLTFSSNKENSLYGGFVLLVEAKLDDNVVQLKVDLSLRLGQKATAEFQPAGKADLTADQLRDAKQYQELLFNGIFGSLLTRSSKVPGSLSAPKFLVATSNKELWDRKRMYLLLPVIPIEAALPADHLQIDWKSISDTAVAAQMFNSFYMNVGAGILAIASKDEVSHGGLAATTCLDQSENLRMGFGTEIKSSDVVGTVVITIHTGLIFVVTKVLKMNSTALFPQGNKSDKFKFTTYCDYFAQKYKHPLMHPDQPLLEAKQTRSPRNFLAQISKFGKQKLESNDAQEDSEAGSVELPPELCVVLGVSSPVLRAASLVPSVMHRLETALKAAELRQVISEGQPQFSSILLMRIAEALTTGRCQEEFSCEGLELLGDSFLKYAQSSYLFVEFDNKHEGQLTARRTREICNAKLHSLAMNRQLPEYIQDEAFDPSCWVPPGRHYPKLLLCRCNLANLLQCKNAEKVETLLEKASCTKEVKIGKSCGNGHRWLCSKTISDVVESLIGAYLVEGGAAGALMFMTWAGFSVQLDEAKVERARTHSSVDPAVNVGADLRVLESILNYSFTNKALLVEAITHASHQELRGGFCYQRLEFLGDAVLDLLITKHLFFSHPGLSPGCLTDLRSAAVNNECFTRIAVKHKFNKYLRHGSGFLLQQIEHFVEACKTSMENVKDPSFGWDGVKGPKVLGDMVESIAGAILVDSGFKLERVWQVMKPLLSPIVTPDTLTLHPCRELHELCQLRGFQMVLEVIHNDNEQSPPTIIITVDTGIEPKLSVTSSLLQKRTSEKEAAREMLNLLQSHGIWHPCKIPMLGESCLRLPSNTDPEQESISIGHK